MGARHRHIVLIVIGFAAAALGAAPAGADVRSVGLVSNSGSNAAATFNAVSTSGARVFFTTTEAIPGTGDVDAAADIHMRQGSTTTLVTPSTASVASFDGISADGTRVFLHTTQALTGGDVDTAADVYQAVNGVYTLLTGGAANTAAVFKGPGSSSRPPTLR